jgi:TM2 domain-containing membrane protein YozV
MKTCQACGNSNPDEANFCLSCGTRLSEEDANSGNNPPAAAVDAGINPPAAFNPPAVSPMPNQATVPPYNPNPTGQYILVQPRPLKQKSTAMLIEILPGLFGLYGFGRIYAGDTGTGVAWLIGGIIWSMIAVIIDLATGGFGFLCTLPVNIICVVICAMTLSSYANKHPELFSI